MTAWPCNTCGEPGVRNIGTIGYCVEHLTELVASFEPSNFDAVGFGLPHTTTLGSECVQCVRCGATWDGKPLESCHYCSTALEAMRRHQADNVIQPPDVDPDDATYDDRMTGWAKRLRVAVNAGLITEKAAIVAMDRASRKAAA